MTICTECGATSPASQRFCGECGTALAAVCPNGHANPPSLKFCGECGAPMPAPGLAPGAITPVSDPGERRLVSVLFADLVGFTPFSESRDPEEVRAMLTRYFDRAREVIERFGGTVDKFIGDAVTAFWGATQGREDDAERAVRAALELVDAVEALGDELGLEGLQARAGVLSGETSVGTGGNDMVVVGDIVNTASRLQSAASPGTVLVGEATKQLTDPAIRYESVGEQELKGKSVPVTAWRALAVTGERGGRGRWEVMEPPFVGREDELRLLKDRLHATTRDRTARLVSIVGEAGIGKSRLTWELLKYVDGITEAFRWHQGRSPAYGEGVTFWALAEMVRSRAGIAETEEPLKARMKLRTTVAENVPSGEEQQWIEPRLAGLLGLAEMPSGDRNELFAAMRTFFQRISERDTAVLVFEDLQWADEGQLEFIEELVEMSPRHPILVITLARPDFLERRPAWGSSGHRFLSLHLGPLSGSEIEELVVESVPGIADNVVALIGERAGGVPLYAVEYIRMLIASGHLVLDGATYRQTRELADVALPGSLHALVGARLDRLDEDSRSLIQDAAVLGQSFTVEGLTALTGIPSKALEPRLRDLARQELLRYETDPRSPERSQFQFVQSVIREVAYGRIAKANRKDRHLKVAEYYRKQAPVEAAAIIASHYMNAYQAGPDDDLAEEARSALIQAARRAAELQSAGQALALVEQALQVPGTDAQRAELWEFAVTPANALFRHEDAIGYARKAFDWHTEHGSATHVVRGAWVLGTAYVEADEPAEAVAAMAPHFDAGRAEEPEMMTLGAELSRAHMRASQDREAAEVALAVMIAAEAAGNTLLVIEALNNRGTVLPQLGRVSEGIALLREALRLAEIHALSFPMLRALNNLLLTEFINGIAATVEGARRGYELAHRIMHGGLLVRMAASHAVNLAELGSFDEAIAVIREVDPGEESNWRPFIEATSEWILWIQTGDGAHLRGARELNRRVLESHEPQYRSSAMDTEIGLTWLEGDLSSVLDLAPQVDPVFPDQLFRHHAIAAALRLDDPTRLRQAISLIGATYGRRFDVLRLAGETALEVLEGDPDRAAARFVDLIGKLEEVESPRIAAEWRAIFAEVMPNRPEAAVAAKEAHDWFTEVGAQGYLDLFSHVWRQQLGVDAALG